MKLIDILEGIEYKVVKGSLDIEINDLNYDSRKIKEGVAFVALRGNESDGHDYIKKAIENGTNCVFIDKDIEIDDDVTVVKLNDTREELGFLSRNLFKNPQKELVIIGITGTKGKTSTSWMISKILKSDGKKVGVIGTVGTIINDEIIPNKNTTPESYELHKYMRMMVDSGIKYLIMEVSSQALKVGRVASIDFDYGIFTNLSIDHVGGNEHPSFEDYVISKAKLFNKCKYGILNIDDEKYDDMLKNSVCKTYSFGKNGKDLKINDIKYINAPDFLGMEFTISGLVNDTFKVSAPGEFSIYNASAAILLTSLIGVKIESIKEALENFKVDGRCEIINGKNFKVIIDYAHNKLSLQSLITTIRAYENAKIVTVFGVGGGRSYDRKYEMGRVSGSLSDFSIVTADNPRNDEIEVINKDIIKGLVSVNAKYIVINDRKEAIEYAIKNATPGEIILLVGKGHETYQEIKGVRYEFIEKNIVNEILNQID